MLHSLTLLGKFPDDLVPSIRAVLRLCLCKDGMGFGGGYMQIAHAAPTYAAILSICTLCDEESFTIIDRAGIYRFFMSIKNQENGAFFVHNGGEIDTRGIFTVLSVASILNILTPELTKGCTEFVANCQSFEGGIAGVPGGEAHGGYSFCGFASLCLLNKVDAIDLDTFVEWVVARQMRLEGGFQGRTNKLVDSCYSFWQGSIPALLERYAGISLPNSLAPPTFGSRDSLDDGSLLFAQVRLQQYLLYCCQFWDGGMRDKPGKARDQYHTCYALSGLSVSQQGGKIV